MRTPFYAGPEHAPFLLGEGTRKALLIHGFPGTPAEMRPLAEVLAGAGWLARGLLLPGMGSDIERLPAMRQALWLDAAREAWSEVRRDDPGAVLVGNSMGAAVALCLAAEAPPGRLVLVSPFWHIGGLGTLLPLLKHVVRTFAPFSRANFGDPALRAELQRLAPGIDLDDPATQQEIRTRMRLPTAVLDEVRRLGQVAYGVAGRVTCPALVLQGTYDRIVRRGDTRRLLLKLGGPLAYCELPEAHELVLLRGPAAPRVRQAVAAFLPGAAVTAAETPAPVAGDRHTTPVESAGQ